MQKKLFNSFHIVFFAVFSAIFATIIFNLVFAKKVYQYSTIGIISIFLLTCVFLCFMFYCIKRFEGFFEKNFFKIVIGCACFLVVIQIVFANLLRFNPIFDFQAIYGSAIHWVETGSFTSYWGDTCYDNYFYVFPNNLGGLAFVALFVKIASIFNIPDTFLFLSTVNSLLICFTMVLTALCCKRLFGAAQGILSVLFFFITIPFYFAGAVFYTDFLSIIYPVLILYLFLRSQQTENKKHRIILYFVIGIACAIGVLIKFTVIIAVIAILIFLIINSEFKKSAFFAGICAITILTITLSFNGVMKANFLNDTQLKELQLPYSYWLMLGVNPWGDFDAGDFSLALEQETYDQKVKVTTDEFFNRIKNHGIGGLAKLYAQKTARCFGDGTLGLSDFLDDRPENQTILHEFLLYNSLYYEKYELITGGVFISFVILMVTASILSIKDLLKKKPVVSITFIAVFGLMLFLVLWEAKSRYITNFVPFIFICAIGSIQPLTEFFKKALHLDTK